MQTSAPASSPSEQPRRWPRRVVADLIEDFGVRRQRYDSVWVSLNPRRLPRYLRKLPFIADAMRWVMVLSDGGRTRIWLPIGGETHPRTGEGRA